MSLMLILFLCAAADVYFVKGDSPPYNPDEELCINVDQCAAYGGMCCEGLRGGCCVNGACVYNSTVCKVNGERCGRIRCKRNESCLHWQPCVCCPNCAVPILPTCKPKCGSRACLRNEVCFTGINKNICVKPNIYGWPIYP